MPIQWPSVLQEIWDDFKGFIEGGGWSAFINDDSDDEENQESEADSEFHDEEEDAESDDDSEFSADEDESSSDYVDEPSDSDAVSWGEMEKKALEHDWKNTSKQKDSDRKGSKRK